VNDAISAQAIIEALRGAPWLRLAVLFGSAARGTSRPDSDLDVGILATHPDVSLWDEADLASRLERASGRKVDVVHLDQASTLLKFEVVRDGKLLLERAPGDFARFREEALGEYLDFIPTYRRTADRFCQVLIERARAVRRSTPT